MKKYKLFIDLFSRDSSNTDSLFPTHREMYESFDLISDSPEIKFEVERLLDKRSSNPNSVRVHLDGVFVGNVCSSQSTPIKVIMGSKEFLNSCKVVSHSLKEKTPFLEIAFVEAD